MTPSLLETLRRHARGDGSAPMLDDGARRLDRAAVLARAERIAERLAGQGVRSAALLADNGVDPVVVALGALAAGVTLVPLPPFFSPRQRRHVLDCVRPDALITDDAGVLAGTATASHPLQGRLALARLADGHAPPANTARITFTSGSTGAPQGVCLSADALTAVARSLRDASGFGPDDRHLCTLPLGVLLEELAGPWRCVLAGATCLLPPAHVLGTSGSSGVAGPVLANALSASRATGAVLVPAMLDALVRALEDGAPRPVQLRFVGVGGAAVPVPLLERAANLGLPVREGYGLSEAGSVVCLDAGAAPRPGWVGPPLPHARVAVNPDGELLVGGPGLAHGKLDAHGHYRPLALDAHGRYATGDLVERARDGSLGIRGRRRNVFITSFGRNVSPEWVERELLAEADVGQAVVFGDGLPGPVAVVVPRTDEVDLEALRARVNARLPDYARLQRVIPGREAFSVANGQWAGTGRPRRDAIAAAYEPLLRPDASPRRAVSPS